MAIINHHYLELKDSYLFSEIARRVSKFIEENKEAEVIRLGIGDVTLPLCPAVIDALHSATDEMAKKESFKGYGPDQGYAFLRELIAQNDFKPLGVDILIDEIFVSDGAKSDTGNITDIFGQGNVALISDPVYPAYQDTTIMAGREIKILPCNEANGFTPEPPEFHGDIIYLCSPNNPTGSVMTREQLKKWVEYAIKEKAVILFDAAYEAFITEKDIPHSIFEIEGARKCAIEFRSFSKKAGFTGTRCGYTVVPKELFGRSESGEEVSIHKLWARRQATKFNGTPYVVQRAAAAVYSTEGAKQVKEIIEYYLDNARIIYDTLKSLGFTVFGGKNAPYIWLKCPKGYSSWDFFDFLLEKLNVVGTPGAGFGQNGEGYFRLSSFGGKEQTIKAMERFKNHFSK